MTKETTTKIVAIGTEIIEIKAVTEGEGRDLVKDKDLVLDHVKGTGIEIMVIAIDVIAVDVTDLQDVVGRDQDRDQEKGKEEIETGTDLIEIEVEIELQTVMTNHGTFLQITP